MPLLASLLSVSYENRYPPLDISPKRQKDRTIKLLKAHCCLLAQQQPLLLIFEDVHWADPTTLDVLTAIIDAVSDTAILLVITYRPEFNSIWQGRGHVTMHSLARLGRRQVAEIVTKVSGGNRLPESLLGEIAAKTDGVPLFVEELTKAVLEAGILRRGADRYILDGSLPSLSVPSTLQDSLVARLDRLASVKPIAQVASVIGREFSYELLAAVAPTDEVLLQEALTRLEQAGIIYCRGVVPDATYAFKHALLQDAAYHSLLKRRRGQLHAELVGVLETDFPEIVAQKPELLAFHHAQAGHPAEAVTYWQQAFGRALEHSAYPEALAHLNSALSLVEETVGMPQRRERELELLISCGGVLLATAGYLAPETRATFLRARELAREVGDSRQSFTVLRGLHGIHIVQAELNTALDVAEECLKMAVESDEREPLALAHRLVGQTLCMQGSLALAREHLEKALDLSGPPTDEVVALIHGGGHRLMIPAFLSHVLWLQGYPDRALKLAQSMLIDAEQQYGVFTLTACLFFLCWIRGWRGEYAVLQELAERQRRLANEHDIFEWVSEKELFTEWALIAMGKPEDLAALARQRLGSVRAVCGLRTPFKLGLLADAIATTNSDEGMVVIDEALAITARTGERWSEAELLRIKALLLLRTRGDLSEIENVLRLSLSVARDQGAKAWELRTATTLARLWQENGKCSEAYGLLAPIYEWFNEGLDTADLRAAKTVLDTAL